MKKARYSYVVIEDDLNVCEGVKERMDAFTNWDCLGLLPAYDAALEVIQKDKPNLLFLDYSIPVSYTHLDVYKRQVLYQISLL